MSDSESEEAQEGKRRRLVRGSDPRAVEKRQRREKQRMEQDRLIGVLQGDQERRLFRVAAGIGYEYQAPTPPDDMKEEEKAAVLAKAKRLHEEEARDRALFRSALDGGVFAHLSTSANDRARQEELRRDYNRLLTQLHKRLADIDAETEGFVGVPWRNAAPDAAEAEVLYRRYLSEKAGGARLLDRPPMTPEELEYIEQDHPWVKWQIERGEFKLTEHDLDAYRDERQAKQQRETLDEESEAEVGEEEEEEEEDEDEEESDDVDDLADKALRKEERREARRDRKERAAFDATVARYTPLVDKMFAAVPEMTAESAFALLMHDDDAPAYFTTEERALFDELRDAQDPILYEALVEGRREERESRVSDYGLSTQEVEEEAASEAEEATKVEEAANEIDKRDWEQFYSDLGPLIGFYVDEQLTSKAFENVRNAAKRDVVNKLREAEPGFRYKDDRGSFIKEAVDRIGKLVREKIKNDVILATALSFVNHAHETKIPLGVVDKYRRFNVNNDARRLSDAFGEEERLSIAEKLMEIVKTKRVPEAMRKFSRYDK